MMKMILTVLIGAGLGALSKLVCDVIVRKLLEKRGKEFTETKKERVWLSAVMALFGALILFYVPLSAETAFMFLLLIACESVAVCDAHTRLIPNELVLAILVLSAVFGIPSLLGLPGFPAWKPLNALIGLAVCFVIFTLPAVMSKQVGAGDIKLAAAMGFCMGLWNSLFAIALMGILVLAYVFAQKRLPVMKFMVSTIPMGPFLSVSMVGVLLAMKTPLLGGIFAAMPF